MNVLFFKKNSCLKSILIIVLIGIVSGIVGMLLGLLLQSIQHIAYGYHSVLISGAPRFLSDVSAASPERRVVVLTLCGLIAGFGWWTLYHLGKPISIQYVLAAHKPRMPFFITFIHVLLQIVTVALGSPLGREVAPREMSAFFACWFSLKFNLSRQEARIMIACAAGAGLAAAYNVPLGGAFFALEVLLGTFQWSALLPAFSTAVIAVIVSWIGLGNEPTYFLPSYTVSTSLVIWSILTGPIFGITAYWFSKAATIMHNAAKENWHLPLGCILNFVLIGLFAIYFPALLGNGKSPAQLAFNYSIGIGFASILLLLRVFVTLSSLRAGARGGLLTPSLANGALLAVLLAHFWTFYWNDNTPLGAFAVIGATAFLAAAQRMPITAIILLLEFTRVGLDFLIPMLFAVVGAVASMQYYQHQTAKPIFRYR